MFKRILITSALPYANGPIHIGHLAGAYLPADLYARYQRLKGRDVLYVCGSDEFGVAIVMRALSEGVAPQEIIDRYHPMIRDSFAAFGMSFDHYGRTSSETHAETVRELFRALSKRDYFRLKTEEQLFDPEAQVFLADRFVTGTCPLCGYEEAYGDQCERCGASLSPQEVLNPRSTLTQAVPELRTTTHWYLRFGDCQPMLEKYVASHPEWKPNVLGQIGSWFADGLRDRAITRDVPWGVPVPEDVADEAGVDAAGKVIYVWFDAPIGYISATREWAEARGEPDRFDEFWKDSQTKLLHFIGKDNIVFHALMFPAMLMGHGEFVVPENVPANEFLNIEGKKLSTSRGWAVWLHEYLEVFPPDLLRYALASTFPETKDSDFGWKDFQTRVNSELADILGNFVHRSLTFACREFDGYVPPLLEPSSLDLEVLEALKSAPGRIGALYERYRFREAVAQTMNIARLGNKYFNDTAPWKTRKTDRQACGNTIHVSLQICGALAILMDPVLPFTAARLRGLLQFSGARSSMPGEGGEARIGWDEAANPCLQSGHRVQAPHILFEKLEDAVIDRQIAMLAGDEAVVPYEDMKAQIDYGTFTKLDLRTGTVTAAERVKKSRKLLRLEVDLGFELRQILAGIAEHYEAADIIGKRVVVVANLKPRRMMGLESQGMVLMAEDREGQLAMIAADCEDGAVVR